MVGVSTAAEAVFAGQSFGYSDLNNQPRVVIYKCSKINTDHSYILTLCLFEYDI